MISRIFKFRSSPSLLRLYTTAPKDQATPPTEPTPTAQSYPSLFSKSADPSLSSLNKVFSFNLKSKDFQPFQSHILHVKATSNNTLLTLTTNSGDAVATSSGGAAGFKKAGRSGHEAAYQATIKLIEKINSKNIVINGLELKFKGLGPGRDACFKALRSVTNWPVVRISDVTPIPFNGCRPRKARRL
ncbi:hypothetical protein BB559_001887 [Furculomyces boomerangus]|uniref:Ribosomal protein S11 n=2 Tax=Harpellales TaxID=61421 RepID=A0A2T9YZP0_9FUNG|nr:hypothetical protein BB559_001887 [Furculomyces boomerangus]PVZ98611.1 hypothetical protein BB558_005392 [Smittium angustum]